MVGQEFDDPIGVEFLRVMNEINYGASVDQALLNLTQRVDVPDLKFFTVSVIIQRESGGNLAEILESIARLIRERFKLQGKIKTLSAEGKLSAIILVGLPFFVVLASVHPKSSVFAGFAARPCGEGNGHRCIVHDGSWHIHY